MSFWKIFKNTANVRISLFIQDKIIEAFKNAHEERRNKTIINNSNEIINAVYNNPFNKKRKSKSTDSNLK
jgi:hypothetical protein